jgi:hypothetical protein
MASDELLEGGDLMGVLVPQRVEVDVGGILESGYSTEVLASVRLERLEGVTAADHARLQMKGSLLANDDWSFV